MALLRPLHEWRGSPTIGDPAGRAASFMQDGLCAVEANDVVQMWAWKRIGYLDLHLPEQPALTAWPAPLRFAAKRWVFGTIAHVHAEEQRDVLVAWLARPKENLHVPLSGVPDLGVRDLNALLHRLAEPVAANESHRLALLHHWHVDPPAG